MLPLRRAAVCGEVALARRQHQPARAVGGCFGHLGRLDDFHAIVPLRRELPFLPLMAFFSTAQTPEKRSAAV